MPVDLRKELRPYRVQYFPCYRNGGERVSARGPHPRDAYPVRNRADRHRAGQTANRHFVNTSPRMRHGIDDNPRPDVMLRRLVRAAVKATTP